MSGVESWLPRFDVRERHERVVAAEPERALAIALETPVCPDRIVRTLFRLRGLGASTASIGEFASSLPSPSRPSWPTRWTATRSSS